MSERRGLVASVVLCLLGSVLVLVSLAREWARVPLAGSALLPDRVLGVSGGELVPGVRALALVGVAGVVGLAATRGRGRTAVGGVLAAVGLAIAVESVRAATDLRDRVPGLEAVRDAGAAADPAVDGSAWPAVAVLGAVLLTAAGVLVATRGSRWSALSQRYEAPVPAADEQGARPAEAGDKALWDDLDRGEDPTRG